MVAHTVHECREQVQEGGTSLMDFGVVIDYLDMSCSGKNETGLGWWSVMTFQGEVQT